MHSENETLFWKKKEFVSFVLSILVFFIHSYFAQDNVGTAPICVFNRKISFFFSRAITQFAVPMFFILSGITFFKGYSNKKYPAKIKSRIFTLILPYLLWNTVWMLWEILCSYSFIAKFSAANEPFPLTAVSLLKGVFFYGCNMPFWFIFDLIIFVFAAPVIFQIIRNKSVGALTIAGLAILSAFGVHLPAEVFYYPTSIIFFMIGAMIGYHYFDFAAQKASRPVQIASAILLATYVLAKCIIPRELQISNSLIEIIVYTAAALFLWNLADMFIERLKPRAIYRRSFAIYAMHLNVAIVILKILSFIAPQNEWLEFPKFIIMVVSTLVIINCICAFLEKFFPKIYALFMGNRIKKTL